jgi:hypothetical protein
MGHGPSGQPPSCTLPSLPMTHCPHLSAAAPVHLPPTTFLSPVRRVRQPPCRPAHLPSPFVSLANGYNRYCCFLELNAASRPSLSLTTPRRSISVSVTAINGARVLPLTGTNFLSPVFVVYIKF